jgi:threonine dehydratase
VLLPGVPAAGNFGRRFFTATRRKADKDNVMRGAHREYLERILLARVYDVAVETPLEPAAGLSRRLNNRILLKREDLQPVFSFKLRGAYNKMVRLAPEDLAMGVITASAGNHAQGVALAARRLGCEATIIMPVTTPGIKIDAVARMGAIVALAGESYSDAERRAQELAAQTGCVFIHPFDDPDIIAGQGSIGMEILRQHPDPITAVFVPIGGGGLAAGVAAYIKHLRPEIMVIGVEPVDSDAMRQSIAAGMRVELAEVGLFADGVAVKLVGEETFALCRDLLDDIITVDTDDMCGAIKDIFEDTRVIAEPAGALSVAGAKAYVARRDLRGATLAAVISGANMNFDRLRHAAERAELGGHREALLAVTIPERAGSFRKFCAALGKHSITELSSRFADPVDAQVLVGIRINSRDDTLAVLESLRADGFDGLDLTDNELAKLHLRYLVGGNAPFVRDERLLRFTFPERPGALLGFMEAMRIEWSFSLVQYRYHGADHGRVLLGVQVPDDDLAAFRNFVDRLGYPYVDETLNPAYRLFLGWRG